MTMFPTPGLGFARSAAARATLAIGLALGLGVLAPASSSHAEEPAPADALLVTLDQAKLVKLPGGTETIIIGNPAIADVAVQKNGVMVITGRSAGRTNFIALDQRGTIISETVVSVTTSAVGRVLVQRGLEQNSYDCSPNCLPTISLGDDEKHFNRATDQVGKRDGMANQAPGAGAAARK